MKLKKTQLLKWKWKSSIQENKELMRLQTGLNCLYVFNVIKKKKLSEAYGCKALERIWKKCLKFNSTWHFEVNFTKNVDNDNRWRKKWVHGHNRNFCVNDLDLIVESQKTWDVDSDPKSCMECFEVFMNRSNLSDMRKGKFEDEIMLVIPSMECLYCQKWGNYILGHFPIGFVLSQSNPKWGCSTFLLNQ